MKRLLYCVRIIIVLCAFYLLTGCALKSPQFVPESTSEQPMIDHSVLQEQPNYVEQSETPFLSNTSSGTLNSKSDDMMNIDFRYIYRGFSAVQFDNKAALKDFAEFGTKIITTETDWNIFMERYCPGIPYYDAWDSSKEYLIASVTMGARPTYVNSNTITSLSWCDGYFAFEYDNDPANYIYVLNNDTTTHFYLEVISVSREDLPDGADVWSYAPKE